jgi:hypothetical protein
LVRYRSCWCSVLVEILLELMSWLPSHRHCW